MAERRPWAKRGLTLTQTLVVAFGTLTVLGIAVVLGTGLWTAWRNSTEFVRDRAALSIGLLVGQINEHLKPTEGAVGLVADLIAQERIDIDRPTELAALVRGTLAAAPQIRNFGFVTPEGRLIGGFRGPDGVRLTDATQIDDPFLRAQIDLMAGRREGGWTGPFWRPNLGGGTLVYRKSVFRGDRFVGVVSAFVHIRDLSAIVERAGAAVGATAFVLVDRNNVLAHASLSAGYAGGADAPVPTLDRIGDPVLRLIWDRAAYRSPLLRMAPPLQNHTLYIDDRTHFVVYRELHGYGERPWQIGLLVGLETFDAEIRRMLLAGGVGLGTLLLSCLAALWIGRRIGRPVQRISEAARLVGELRVAEVKPLPGSRIRELDEQSMAFNAMVRGLTWFESYVPKSLARHLLQSADGGAIASDQRNLTVMFTDIAGFSGWAEGRDAGEVAAFLNSHFGLLAHAIEAEGGTIDKFIGDAVMAFWGAPEKQKNRAERACRAALAIRAAIALDNEARARRGEAPVRMRIGIHSGEATVGNIGAPRRLNYTAIGDMVNVANRIEQLAKELPLEAPGVAVVVSEATRADIGGSFRTRSLGRHALRGRAEALELFELT